MKVFNTDKKGIGFFPLKYVAQSFILFLVCHLLTYGFPSLFTKKNVLLGYKHKCLDQRKGEDGYLEGRMSEKRS